MCHFPLWHVQGLFNLDFILIDCKIFIWYFLQGDPIDIDWLIFIRYYLQGDPVSSNPFAPVFIHLLNPSQDGFDPGEPRSFVMYCSKISKLLCFGPCFALSTNKKLYTYVNQIFVTRFGSHMPTLSPAERQFLTQLVAGQVWLRLNLIVDYWSWSLICVSFCFSCLAGLTKINWQ